MTRTLANVLMLIICTIGLALVVGNYLRIHPTPEAFTTVFAAWAGGILVTQLWNYTALDRRR